MGWEGGGFASVNSPPRDHAGVAGGCTRRVGEELEVVSPQQVWRAGRETLNSSTQRQEATLRLNLSFWSFVRVDTHSLSPK